MRNFRLKFVAAFAALSLSGCAMDSALHNERKAEAAAKDYTTYMDAAVARAEDRLKPAGYGSRIAIFDKPYIGAQYVKTPTGKPLPSIDVDLDFNRPVSLVDIAAELSAATGIPIMVGNFNGGGGATGAPGAATVPSMRLEFRGTLSSALDYIAARAQAFWHYKDGVVTIARFETKTYTLYSLPSDNQVDLGINASLQGSAGSSGSGSGSGGASPTGQSLASQSVKSGSKINIWGDIEKVVKSVLGPTSSVISSAGLGGLTVIATPAEHRLVEEIVNENNERLARLVEIDVRVVSVTLSKGDQFNFDPGLVIRSVTDGLRFSATGPASLAQAQAGIFRLGVVSPPNDSPLRNLDTTNLALQALRSVGSVTTRYSAYQSTSNNRALPYAINNSKRFVEQTKTDLVSSAGSSTALTPGTVTTGFNLTVLPRILSKGRLLLTFKIDISELKQIRTVTAGTATIELPEVDSRSLQQEVALESGSTVMLAGFAQDRSDSSRQGTATPDFLFLGGGQNANDSKTLVVILVTPRVVKSPLELAAN